jgi:hypothetical protein
VIEESLYCAYCRAPGVAVCAHIIGWLVNERGYKDLETPEAFTCSLVVCAACVVKEAAGQVCLYHAGRPAGSALLTFGTAACVQGNLRHLAADGGLTKPFIQWSVTAPPVTVAVPIAAVAMQGSLFD